MYFFGRTGWYFVFNFEVPMMLYLIKLFFPEKKKIVTSKVLTCPFLLSYA